MPPIFEECAIEVFRFRSSVFLGIVKITILDFYDRRRAANTTLGTIKHEVEKQSSINLDTKNSRNKNANVIIPYLFHELLVSRLMEQMSPSPLGWP